jgi:hypothetical protein
MLKSLEDRYDWLARRYASKLLNEEIVSLYRQGYSLYKVGELVNLSHGAVRARLIKLGIPRRSHKEAGTNMRGGFKPCLT